MNTTDRDIKFGRLLAIANVLANKAKDKDEIGIADKHLTRYDRKPALTLERIHSDLLKYADRFGKDEMMLLDMFGEIMASLDGDEFNNEPLSGKYLQAYYAQQHDLDNVIGVEEASELWGLSPGTIKNYCAEGRISAKKIGKTWVIDKNQNNPRIYERE
ncbi:type I-C CRISPR-associated protein Cas8c/Csd1 [Paenibacillus sp. VCA1]|uniref:type I-C CRISPR-associated protein Cas8c/Csd1 n=1 Tax=Paenibacillus sp. VCA1 TaxID=3039148 RepID=UPI002870D157|nr:type I-C CRISPR-associated protein Cas8c/Csd1 [Paenibacillus sp. VCA1]MDR9852908.1 type I-C CRISPR-associated protein Cas8c/Csd1 [Paenibacillus sp. VCA1]